MPFALALIVYWPGLLAWFQQDDFAFPALFGMHALPYRVLAFLTQFGCLILLASVARRVTGSRAAGTLAAVFWTLNSGLVLPMTRTSAYKQILCTFFLLLAFHFLLRRLETGDRRWMGAEWLAFAAGLASLGIMAVYPAIAAVYTGLRARKQFASTIPMLGVSAACTLAYYLARPLGELHFDASILAAFRAYWSMALGPAGLAAHFETFPGWIGQAGTILLSLSLPGIAAWGVLRCKWAGLFGLAWFALALAPVLPLRYHVSSYYLTAPSVGLALTLAWGVVEAWKQRGWRPVAASVAAVYMAAGAVGGSLGSRTVAEESWRIRDAVVGAARARAMFPNKTIVLAGIDDRLFWTGIVYDPFRRMGLSGVFLEPGTEQRIKAHPELGRVSDFVIPADKLKAALEKQEAVVYAVEPGRLRGQTVAYTIKAREEWRVEEPSRVDVGDQALAGQLGPSWSIIEGGHRWMPRTATVRLRGPRTSGEKIYISGWCPPQQIEKGPLRLRVTVAGKPLPPIVLRADKDFQAALPLPSALAGAPSVDVVIEVDRTFRVPGDLRDLGLVFGTFEIRP
ncbi:MAG: hypothetical protein ACM336_10535 [Acidobacteriota bacterium]